MAKKRGAVCLIGSFDTKSEDLQFLLGELKHRGFPVVTIDTSVVGPVDCETDVSAEEVAAAGGEALKILREKGDRGCALSIMQKGLRKILPELYEMGKISGVIGAGGGAGTSVITAAMRELPIGVPKLMVTTLASGQTDIYVGQSDIVMFPSIVDIAGVNMISADVYRRAAGAVAGMMEAGTGTEGKEKLIAAATMFGNTTAAVKQCTGQIGAHGRFEPVVFHATGAGGKTMEALVRQGRIAGVIDMTTTELADELAGGVLSAGPDRLTAAGEKGVPQVVVPGCVDMVNFWSVDTVPSRYRRRHLYSWNPNVTLMRTTKDENWKIGKIIAEKVNSAKGPSAVFLPLRGVSLLDSEGGEFWDPEADAALFDALRRFLSPGIDLYELSYNINDTEFADAAADAFLRAMEEHYHAIYQSE